MSGTLKVISVIFFPLVLLYTLLICLRNKFYDWNLLKSCRVDRPVISVGNIQIGGTGKTPLVEWLVGELTRHGHRPVILTRGYRRKEKKPMIIHPGNRKDLTADRVGDEPLQLSRNLPDTVISVDADRCRSAAAVTAQYPATVLILDDGLQHRRIVRDLDIVIIDMSRWSACPLLFPATSFRDSRASLQRADIVVFNHPASPHPDLQHLRRQVGLPENTACFSAQYHPVSCISLDRQQTVDPVRLYGLAVGLFCGIAHPGQFYQMMEKLGTEIRFRRTFPDHHIYREGDIRELIALAEQNQVDMVLTTQKDAVKLSGVEKGWGQRIYQVRIEMSINDSIRFINLIEEHVPPAVSLTGK